MKQYITPRSTGAAAALVVALAIGFFFGRAAPPPDVDHPPLGVAMPAADEATPAPPPPPRARKRAYVFAAYCLRPGGDPGAWHLTTAVYLFDPGEIGLETPDVGPFLSQQTVNLQGWVECRPVYLHAGDPEAESVLALIWPRSPHTSEGWRRGIR